MRRGAVAALALLPLWPAAAATEEELAAWRWGAPLFAACLGGDREAFAYGVDGRHRVLIRISIQRGDGRREVCTVHRFGAPRPVFAPSDAPPPAPSAPAFFLERRCVDARRIDAEDGRVLGWLAYPGC